jgi:transcriptional antiterminator RfaH
MPLHNLTTPLYPETILEGPPPAAAAGEPWWVLHTKPRAEKILAVELLRRSVAFYLPLYQRRFRHRGQALVSQLPLFPGYLFLRGDSRGVLQALKTRSVVRSIPVSDQAGLHEDLRRLHHLLTSGVATTPEERLRPGMWVEITSGPLQGLHGKVIREGGQSRFVVEVNFLCRGASCEVEGWTLRPLDAAAWPEGLVAGGTPGAGSR